MNLLGGICVVKHVGVLCLCVSVWCVVGVCVWGGGYFRCVCVWCVVCVSGGVSVCV